MDCIGYLITLLTTTMKNCKNILIPVAHPAYLFLWFVDILLTVRIFERKLTDKSENNHINQRNILLSEK